MRTQYATFTVAELFFGIDVLRVQEVLRYQEMTRVPLAPVVAEGLINLRGQIVTAIDMRRKLGLPPREPGRLPMNMVVRSEDGPVSLLVDEIGDVLQPEEESFEPAPDNAPKISRELLLGVYKLKDRLLLVLDPDRTLGIEEALSSRT
jgi:purine-binding chemotaxis protein CheW